MTGDGRVVFAAFIASPVLAGGNAVAIRFSNRELDPLWGAGLLFALAAVVLAAVMAVLRLNLPRERTLLGALVRRFPRVHPVTMNAVGMAAGAALLLAGSALAGESHGFREVARPGPLSCISSSPARLSCSCSTSSFSSTGPRRVRRTGSCSSRSSPSRFPPGWTTSPSAPGSSWEGCSCSPAYVGVLRPMRD